MPLKHFQITTQVFQITPEDINTSNHFWDAFNHSETEISANWIVRFCQQRGEGWKPFSLVELEKFYSTKHKDGFTFNKLVNGGWIVLKDGWVYVTADFICRCFESSPNPETIKK